METEEIEFIWADIMACEYCKHYRWVGTHGASQFCQNEESPYYDHSRPQPCGMRLSAEQKIKGCEKIEYNGTKIPAPLFKIIPKDSLLRKYPLDQIVDGFAQEMDLESELTVEQLTEKNQRSYDNLLEMFKKHKTLKLDKGNRLVPADSSE